MTRVVSSNPFDGLTDEQDVPKQQQKKKTATPGQPTKPKKPAQASTTPAAPSTTTAPAKESAPAAPIAKNAPKAGDQKENQQKGPKAQGGQLQGKPLAQRAGVNNPAPAPAQVSQPIVGEDQPALVEKDKSHRITKDRRDGPRPPRQGDAGPPHRPHQRVFDRKSGTGRPMNENKKDGSGKGNWGNENDTIEALAEVEAQEAAGRDAAEATNAEGPAASSPAVDRPDRKKNRKDKTGDAAVEEEAPKEPEKPTMSYEEYLLKQKEAKKPKVEKLKVRTVEVGDLTGMTLIKRDSEEPSAPLNKKKDQSNKNKDQANNNKDAAAKDQKKPKVKTPQQLAKEKEEEQRKKDIAAAQNSIAEKFVHPPINSGENRRGGGAAGGGRGGGRFNGERRSDERKERSTFNRTPGSGRGRGGNPNNHQAVADTPAEQVADKPIFMAEDFPSIAPTRPANSPSLGNVNVTSQQAAAAATTKA